tara:strand:+ start:53 stop:886 length:834 start_codon:yes stop_codon:yes gene_type:complete
MAKTLVILGDCASNGANCIASEVTNDNEVRVSYSLQYHNQHEQIIKWYLKQRQLGKYKNPISINLLQHESLKAYRQSEMEVSWPSHLECKTYNYSWNGNTFQGNLIDIKSHIASHGKPNLVAITCYSPDHVYVRVNNNTEKYSGIVHQSWIDKPYNADTMSYSEAIYNKKQTQGKKQLASSQTYLNRKAYHAWYWLTKFLKTNNIDYFCIRYRHPIVDDRVNVAYDLFETEKMLDIRELHDVYCHPKDGDKSLKKLEYQPIIAKKINQYLREDLKWL